VLTNLIRASVYLGRLDEALAASEEMLALQPDDPGAIEWMAIPHLVEGDLPGARAVIRQAMQHVSVPDMVTYFAGYNELAFALEPQDRELLYRLTPAAFDNDRAWWSQALSIAAHQQGDERRARAYADSGLAESRAQSAMNPDDSQLRALYAVMLAYAGHGTDAIREVERAMEQARPNRGQDNVYSKMQGVRVYIATGQAQKALDLLGVVMNQQYFVTPGYLKVDPTFDPLRNDPRFQKLVAQPIKTASGD
jgi:Flp pilus assembly protein TadD